MTKIEQAAQFLQELRQMTPTQKIAAISKIDAAPYVGDFPCILREAFSWAYDPFKRFRHREEIPASGDGTGANWEQFTLTLHLISSRAEDYRGRYEIAHELKRAFCDATPIEHEFMQKVLFKDLDCGMDVKTINKAYYHGFIPEYTPALAKKLDKKKLLFPCLAQVKYNGARLQAHVDTVTRTVEYLSRQGLPMVGFNHLNTQCLRLADALTAGLKPEFACNVVLDGEIMWERFGKGNRRANAGFADFVVYDYVFGIEWQRRKSFYKQVTRTEKLNSAIERLEFEMPGIRPAHGLICYSMADVDKFFNEVVEQGGEGVMLKQLSAPYSFGRSNAWQKYKPVNDIDLKIVGFKEGTGKYAGMLGALRVKYGAVFVDIGTGFDDAQRADFWARRFELLGKTAEIQYREITPDGSLLHTNFVRLRDDK